MNKLGDFHIHSRWSGGELTLTEIVDCYGDAGFDVIAITDRTQSKEKNQRTIPGISASQFDLYRLQVEKEAKRAWKQYRMRVISGIEIEKNSINPYRSAHLVILNPQTWFSGDGKLLETLEKVQHPEHLVIAAHPVSTRRFQKQTFALWTQKEKFKNYIDAWEIASGSHLFSEVLHSGLPMIASSDFKRREDLTSWKTTLSDHSSMESIFYQIRSQKIGFTYFDELEQKTDTHFTLNPFPKLLGTLPQKLRSSSES
ncbi:MAG: hypothetical protein CL678_13715 [Bdellovibrionaceae bacterium]|nr:hypothetical protein [Pseudobdellovibrionaceae bacterium]|tara:strand:- start:76 stop:843 length:768 start_codon:yes stop_codon:yes gene_type:complete